MNISPVSFGKKIPVAACRIKDNTNGNSFPAVLYELDCNDKEDIYTVRKQCGYWKYGKDTVNAMQTKYNSLKRDSLFYGKSKSFYILQKNNDESSNDNRYSIINFYRNIHLRNRSQLSNNISNTKIIKINRNDKLVENSKNDFKDYIRKKINIIKSFETNKRSLEINGNNKEVNDEKKIMNNNNKNISEIQNNSQVKPFLSYFDNISKKSRNIVNNNLIEYNNTCENNKNLGNNNTLFKTSNNNIKQENEINKGFIFKLTKDKNNIANRFRNRIFQTNIINNKEINIQPKNFILQKYKKKKINQICCFNHDNRKTKSGNNIFAKNINKINIIHSKGIIQ